MSDAIFPLPLSVYEEFMLADDRPAYPMNFFCRLRWLGQIRPAGVRGGAAGDRAAAPAIGGDRPTEGPASLPMGRRREPPAANRMGRI